MIDHRAFHLAVRARALTLAVVTTGSATLEATTTGYARATGSFLTDGFAPGMEAAPTGFTQTTAAVVTAVTATTMAIKGGRTVQASGAGRTLAVGLPALRGYENVAVVPVAGEPYVVEEYLPGAAPVKVTAGAGGLLEITPLYVLRFYAPPNTGISALRRYADAAITLFAPGQPITVGSDTATVRDDLGPNSTPVQQTEDGWAVLGVTVSLRLRTANSR